MCIISSEVISKLHNSYLSYGMDPALYNFLTGSFAPSAEASHGLNDPRAGTSYGRIV